MSTKQARHPKIHVPWIWLQEREPSGTANNCACRLDAAGPNGTSGAAFYMCPTHEQAPAMLIGLREALNILESLEHQRKEAALARGMHEPSEITRAIAKIGALLARVEPAQSSPHACNRTVP